MKKKTTAKAKTNRVEFRAPSFLLAFLEERREGEESLGETARRLLGWLAALLREGLEEIRGLGLSEPEALEILGALNGVLITPETAPLLWAEVAERLGDDHPLPRKIRALSPAGRFALADLAARFWAGDGDARQRLRAIGFPLREEA